MNLAYHFVDKTLRDGRSIPADGEWLEHHGDLKLCESGLHWSACPFDAIQYAPGNTLCLVQYDGETIHGDDKGVSRRRRIIKRIDAEPLMREFARWCALQVIGLWDAPDVVREYLTTGSESLRVAAWAEAAAAAWVAPLDATWSAAEATSWSAAEVAACDAARAAARDAAWAAAWAWSREATSWAAAEVAACDAARAAARDAAWSAAWAWSSGRMISMSCSPATVRAAQREHFRRLVDVAFQESK